MLDLADIHNRNERPGSTPSTIKVSFLFFIGENLRPISPKCRLDVYGIDQVKIDTLIVTPNPSKENS